MKINIQELDERSIRNLAEILITRMYYDGLDTQYHTLSNALCDGDLLAKVIDELNFKKITIDITSIKY